MRSSNSSETKGELIKCYRARNGLMRSSVSVDNGGRHGSSRIPVLTEREKVWRTLKYLPKLLLRAPGGFQHVEVSKRLTAVSGGSDKEASHNVNLTVVNPGH